MNNPQQCWLMMWLIWWKSAFTLFSRTDTALRSSFNNITLKLMFNSILANRNICYSIYQCLHGTGISGKVLGLQFIHHGKSLKNSVCHLLGFCDNLKYLINRRHGNHNYHCSETIFYCLLPPCFQAFCPWCMCGCMRIGEIS